MRRGQCDYAHIAASRFVKWMEHVQPYRAFYIGTYLARGVGTEQVADGRVAVNVDDRLGHAVHKRFAAHAKLLRITVVHMRMRYKHALDRRKVELVCEHVHVCIHGEIEQRIPVDKYLTARAYIPASALLGSKAGRAVAKHRRHALRRRRAEKSQLHNTPSAMSAASRSSARASAFITGVTGISAR